MYLSLLHRSKRWTLVFALLACVLIGFAGFAGTVTTTTIDSHLPHPSVYGQNVVFKVSVSGVQTPSGTVTLKEVVVSLGAKDLALDGTLTGPGTFQVTFNVTGLSVGDHTITAEYGGDVGYDYEPDTSDPVTQTVEKRSTTTDKVLGAGGVGGPSSGYVNEELTFTVQVKDTSDVAGSPSFNGSANLVTWTVSGAASATLHGTVDSDGEGTIAYTPAVVGNFTITAHYEGNAAYAASATDGSKTFTVNKRPTTTTVTGDTAGVVNETLTFNVKVNDDSSAGGTSPSFDGTATVTWSSTEIGGTFGDGSLGSDTCTVDSTGQGTITYTPSTPSGVTDWVITAVYAGNAFYVGSTSDSSHEVDVDKRTTDTTVGGPVSGFVDQELTFTVQVNDTSGAGGTSPSFNGAAIVTWSSTGSGTFSDSVAPACVCTSGDCEVPANGQCTITYTPSGTGPHTIKAEYAGNDYYVASSPDGSSAVTVNERTTSTTVTGPFDGYVDQQLTFTVQVNDTSGAGGTSPSFDGTDKITWTVTLPDGTVVTPAASPTDVTAGQSTVQYTPDVTSDSETPPVDFTVTAHYLGNDDYEASSPDDSHDFTVNKRTTSTTTTGPSTGFVDQELTFTVDVDDSSGAGIPSPDFGTTNQIDWTINSPRTSISTAARTSSPGRSPGLRTRRSMAPSSQAAQGRSNSRRPRSLREQTTSRSPPTTKETATTQRAPSPTATKTSLLTSGRPQPTRCLESVESVDPILVMSVRP